MKIKREILYWLLAGLVTFVFIASALFKLFGGEATAEMAVQLGGQNNMRILAILELAIVVTFFIRKTSYLGVMLMACYMAGAIATLFVSNQSILVPLIVEILIFSLALVRFPQIKDFSKLPERNGA